jgi:hypothetical protein
MMPYFGENIQILGLDTISTRNDLGNLDYVSDSEKHIIKVLNEMGGAALKTDVDNRLKNIVPRETLSRYYHRLYKRGWIDIYVLYKPYQHIGKAVMRGIALTGAC